LKKKRLGNFVSPRDVLVAGCFNPIEKYANVKMGSSSPILRGEHIQKIFKKTPPSATQEKNRKSLRSWSIMLILMP